MWIDSKGKFWNGSFIVVEDKTIINPTTEQLIAAGYTEYVKPEMSDEQKLMHARVVMLNRIANYDASDAVNSFTIGNQQMWLTVAERQQVATQISANESIGRESMTRWFNGQQYTFSLTTWKQMLVALEVYAGDALNITESHKAAINAMDNIADIEAYDYTQGYPEKLAF